MKREEKLCMIKRMRRTPILIFLILVAQPVLYSANDSLRNDAYSVCSALSALMGKGYHTVDKLIWHYQYTRLKPENEAFARSVAEDIGVIQKIEFYALPPSQSHIGHLCSGNHIYLYERDFDYYKHHKHALRFVIAHELMHAEKFHILKEIAAMGTLHIALDNLIRKLSQISPVKKRIDALQETMIQVEQAALSYTPAAFETSLKFTIRNLLFLARHFLLAKAVKLALRPLSRAFEKEADLKAFTKLSKNAPLSHVKEGAKTFLLTYSSQKKRSWWKRAISTHPPLEERLDYIQKCNP